LVGSPANMFSFSFISQITNLPLVIAILIAHITQEGSIMKVISGVSLTFFFAASDAFSVTRSHATLGIRSKRLHSSSGNSYVNALYSTKPEDSLPADDLSPFNATATTSESEEAPPPSTKTSSKEESLTFLQALGAITGRGEFASKSQKQAALLLVTALEAENPTKEPALADSIQGRWELVYCSTQLFRSSPFFMAGRAVCQTESDRKQYDWFCDMHRKALAISNIGAVRQIISSDRLVSEFEVKAGAIPFLPDVIPIKYSGGIPVTIDGALVSSADWTPTTDGHGFELYVDTVEVKGSNVPGLRQLLDSGVSLQSRKLAEVMEKNIASYSTPRVIFNTTYLDERYRISRDQDSSVFFYVKTSFDSSLTNYSDVDADLGLGRLLEGFNDAVTRIYL
jgi:hypothetical protein